MTQKTTLTPFVVEALKNCAAINPSLLIMPGNTVMAMTTNLSMIAKIELDTDFGWRMPIYDMNQFLGVVTSMETPELTNSDDDKYVTISSGRAKTKMFYGSMSVNVFNPKIYETEIKFPESVVDFLLTESDFKEIQKMSQILQAPDMVIRTQSGRVTVSVTDRNNKTTSKYTVDVGETDYKDAEFFIRNDTLKLLPGDYNVSLAPEKISRFSHTKINAVYFVAQEQK